MSLRAHLRLLAPKKRSQIKIAYRRVDDHPQGIWSDGDETDVSHSNSHVIFEPVTEVSHLLLATLAKRKTLVQVASNKQNTSLFHPRQASTHFQILEHRSRSPFAITFFNDSRYLSIHCQNQLNAKGYVKYKQTRGRNNDSTIILLDEYQEPVALCSPDSRDLLCKHAYVIYSRRPLGGNEFGLEAVQHKGATFYPWIRVALIQETLAINIWNGQDFEGTFVATQVRKDKRRVSSFSLEASSVTRTKRGGYKVTCQAGADPAVMICLAAVFGEFS